MIDCVLKFASAAAAKTALPDDAPNDWLLDHCIPGVTVWRKSLEITAQVLDPLTGLLVPSVTITPLAGFFVLVSMAEARPAIINATQVQFAVDRELAVTRDRAALIKNNLTLTLMNDIRMSPVFAGMDWPWGAWA